MYCTKVRHHITAICFIPIVVHISSVCSYSDSPSTAEANTAADKIVASKGFNFKVLLAETTLPRPFEDSCILELIGEVDVLDMGANGGL